MNATPESKNQAASMKVGTSHYVATSALAVIGGASALYTYISQTFEPSTGFYILMLGGLGALVLSIILGGRGADDATSAVANGTWSMSSGADVFNKQAVLTLIGLIAVLVATVIGASSDRQESTVEARVEVLEKEVRQFRDNSPARTP